MTEVLISGITEMKDEDVNRIVRATLQGSLNAYGKAGQAGCHDRVMACFLVLCSHIATIEDAASREDIIESLTDMARSQVAKHRKTAGKGPPGAAQ